MLPRALPNLAFWVAIGEGEYQLLIVYSIVLASAKHRKMNGASPPDRS
jgi:hypothetical protein